jgi:hypothetical protein
MKIRLAIVAALLAWLATPAFAHRLDEYLQATLVSIEPGRVRLQMNLTPGVDIAEKVLARIDGDRDGVISAKEATAYAKSLQRDLIVKMDERSLKLKLIASSFSAPAELRSGWGMIQMEFSAAPGSLSTGEHRLTILNHHLPGISVYLFNAAQPEFFTAASSKSNAIEITSQRRNQTQSACEIEFTYHAPLSSSIPTSFKTFGFFVWLAELLIAIFAGARWRERVDRVRAESPGLTR